ncbi:MAG: hypothetical protein F4Y67_05655 [Chloroflexi bacterium]|nr:hypothetical protein [Chloroflexota bacterium]MDE2702653.1 hypothetical protein [Chloroflexota bacterium]MDE2936447.1 hypothetical protein [Chloroflexota bacterium]MXW28707.1 hypothetical protein [Chloroflexota bacterium]MXX65442.1 hypothetical protein [Chloroflexota bacterium]
MGEVRDAAVIVLAAVAVLSTLTALITVAVLWRFVNMLRRELLPIVESLAETASTLESVVNTTVESRAGSALRTILSTTALQQVLGIFLRRR